MIQTTRTTVTFICFTITLFLVTLVLREEIKDLKKRVLEIEIMHLQESIDSLRVLEYTPQETKLLETPIEVEIQRVKQDTNTVLSRSEGAKYMASEEYKLEGDGID